MSGLLSTLQAATNPVKDRISSASANFANFKNAVAIDDKTSFSSAMQELLSKTQKDSVPNVASVPNNPFLNSFANVSNDFAKDVDDAINEGSQDEFSLENATNPLLKDFSILDKGLSKDFDVLLSKPANIEGFNAIAKLSDSLMLSQKFANAIIAA